MTLNLGRAFFLESKPYDGQSSLVNASDRDQFAPIVSSGGLLEVDAPYIRFDSALQYVSTPLQGTPGSNIAIFRADQIDISGAVLFDQSISQVELDATNALTLTGVAPWQQVFNSNPTSVPNSLMGQLAVSGDLAISAGQVYPTTGSTFYVTSAAADGTIIFARSTENDPATPYSAGGNLTVQADTIVQGGVIQVPIGHLTLGGSDPLEIQVDGAPVQFAPGTQSLDVDGEQRHLCLGGWHGHPVWYDN